MIEHHRSLLLVLAAVTWILCGILATGFKNGFWRGRYHILIYDDGRSDLIRELIFGLLFGPLALICNLICTDLGRYGWTLSGSRKITKDDDRRRRRVTG